MKRMSSLAIVPLLSLFLALTACSGGGGDGGSGGGSSSSSAAEKGVISGNVSVSSSLTSGQSLSVTITADSTTAVASTKSDDYYASEPSSGQTAPTQQLTPTVTVPVDADGNFTAQVPAGTSYSTAVHLSSALSQKSGTVSRAPAAAGLGSIIGDIAVEPGKKIVLNLDDSHMQQPGTVTLRVADAFTSAAVADATVTLIRTGESAVTAADGSVTFTAVLPGSHTLLIESAGYADVTRDFTLTPGQALDLGTLNLNSQSGTVVGQVAAAGFDSLAGIVVYLRGIDGSIYSVFTNASGLYRFERIPAAGGYSVLASANGLRSEKVDNIEVATGATSSVATLHLGAVDDEDAGAITGFARFAERADFAHAGIIVSIEGTDLEAITARDGSFILNNVPAGTYTLNYTDSNHQTVTREGVRVVATAATKLAPVVLASVSGGLSGEIRAQGGAALSGAVITVSDTGDRTVSDGSGQFTFAALPVGGHTLEVSLPGYTTTTIPVTIAANTTTPIATAIELVPHHFSGRVALGTGVTDRSGVSVTLTGGASYAATTSSDGGFSFAAVPPGNYQLTVTMSGYKSQNLAVYIPAEEADYALPYDIQMTLNYGNLGGVVKLQNAEDHSGTVVTVAGTPYTTQTDINGTWVMSLPEGSYAGGVQYAHAGFISRSDTAAFAIVGEQSTARTTVTLAREVGSISGLVLDDSASPLGGVTVSEPFSGVSTTTGANGSFTLANIPVGTRTVTASLAGHVRGSAEVTVTSGATSDLGAPLTLAPYQFQGTVSLGKEVTDHSGVELVLEGAASKTTFSAADGSFSFPAVPAGNYRLTLSKAGYVSEAINLVLPDVAVYTLPYQVTLVKAEAQMKGVVELSGRSDHSGVIVTVIDANAVNHQTVTNTLGQWLISLPTGVTYSEVRYSIADYQGQTTTNGGVGYTLNEGDSLDLGKVVLLPDIGTLSGRVVDGGGTAIAEAQVTMANATHTFTATTDASGNYSRSDVVTGSYTASVFKAGYGTAQSAGLAVTQGATTTANFTLIANQIAGSITLEGLNPGAYGGIPIVLRDGTGTQQGSTTTASDGTFTLTKVVAGTYTLVVNQGGNSSYQVNSIPLTLVGNDGYLFTSAIEVRKTPLVADRDLLTFDYIKGGNSSENDIRYNLVLPTAMPNGSTVAWVSDNEAIITAQGLVTLPYSTVADKVVRLEATLSTAGVPDQKVTFDLSVPARYQPKFVAAAQSLSLDEDFGYVFKGLAASNENGEPISYAILDNSNGALLESVSIDTHSGEIALRSMANQHGTTTLTIQASSGVPALTATASLTITVNPVADPVTAEAGPDQLLTPDTLVTLDGSGSSDVDGDATYQWEVIASPSGSTAALVNANEVNATFTPDIAGDYAVRLTISNSSYNQSDTLTLRAYPQLTVADQSVTEGNNVTFTLTLSHDHDYPITLNYATADLTAQMFKDYQPQVGSLTFDPGVNSLEIVVPVTIDKIPEAQEQFTLVLSKMTGLTENSAAATATIDYAPLDLFYLTGKNGVEFYNAGSSYNSYKDTNAMIGDVNGDGFDDISIGAPYDDKITVVFGRSSMGATMGRYNLSSGYDLIVTTSSTGTYLGSAVTGAGDFNGDGIEDLVVGAPYGGDTHSGAVYVIYGKYGSSLTGTMDLSTFITGNNGLRITGEGSYSRFGETIAGIGDVNGDGYHDILIGAQDYDSRRGRSYIIYGGADYTADLSLASPGSHATKVDGAALGDRAGAEVGASGDVNGDGYMDLLVAAPYAASNTGNVYLIFGAPTLPATITLDPAGIAQGVVYQGRTNGVLFGSDVASAGDFNGDGFPDLVIGASSGGVSWSGEAFVLYGGKSLTANSVVATDTLSAAQGLRINGYSPFTYAGAAVAGIGDLNGDGRDDVLIGAYAYAGNTGEAYVVYGGATGDVSLNTLDGSNGFSMRGVESGVQLGAAMGGRGDFNGDGYYDLLVANGIGQSSYLVFGGNYNSRVTADLVSSQSYDGSSQADRIVGDDGGEVIRANGGADAITAGNGEDRITVSDLSFSRVDGGRGWGPTKGDVLYVEATGSTLDLTAVGPEAIRNIEAIHFDGNGPNTLVLDAAAVRRLNSQMQAEASGPMFIVGGEDDKVELLDAAEWTFERADPTGGSITTYTHSSGAQFMASRDLPTFPAISVEDVSVNEDRGTVKVRVRRENGVYESQVAYQLIDGTALAGTHYEPIPGGVGTVNFALGELVKEVTIPLIRDVRFESMKSFLVGLSQPVNAVIGQGTATVMIYDDTVDLSVLDATKGATFTSAMPWGYLGESLSAAGDVNGDGYEDLIFGAGQIDPVVIFGGNGVINGADDLVLDSTYDSAAGRYTYHLAGIGFQIDSANWYFNSVTAIGDINGDGYDDLAVGYYYMPMAVYSGTTQIIFGGPTIGANGVLDLNTYDPARAISVNGIAANDSAGQVIARAGDVNSDGYDDLLIAAPQRNSSTGEVYLVYGHGGAWSDLELSALDGLNGVKMTGTGSYTAFGNAIGAAGDVDGDGYDDFIIGTLVASKVYVVRGGATPLGTAGVLSLSDPRVIQLQGKDFSMTGSSVAGIGDFNHDGFDDLLIGAPYNDVPGAADGGEAYVVYGSATFSSLYLAEEDDPMDSTVKLNGANGFVIRGGLDGNGNGMRLGDAVGHLGDMNGDGYDDVLVAASNYNAITGQNDARGKIFILYGNPYATSVKTISSLDVSSGFAVTAEGVGDYFGARLGGAGDINGDGFADLLVSASHYGQRAQQAGRGYLIYGGDFLDHTYYVGTASNDKNQNHLGTHYYPKQGNDYVYVYDGVDYTDYVFLGQGDDGVGLNFWGTFTNSLIGKIDGGKGADSLMIAYGTLNLTTVANNRIKGIETLNLHEVEFSGGTDAYSTALTLGVGDIMAMLDSDKHVFSVNGDLGDSVAVTDGSWTYNGIVSANGLVWGYAGMYVTRTYKEWSLNGTPIKLRIDTDITNVTGLP